MSCLESADIGHAVLASTAFGGALDGAVESALMGDGVYWLV